MAVLNSKLLKFNNKILIRNKVAAKFNYNRPFPALLRCFLLQILIKILSKAKVLLNLYKN